MSDKYILRSGAIDAIKRNAGTLYTREAEFFLQKLFFCSKMLPQLTLRRWFSAGTMNMCDQLSVLVPGTGRYLVCPARHPQRKPGRLLQPRVAERSEM